MAESDSHRTNDGRAFSPVIRADTKFFGPPAFLCVDVRFADVAQLDALIAALTKLREFPDDGFDHVHVQDVNFSRHSADESFAEVTFWHPSVQRNEIDEICVSEARRFLTNLPPDRQAAAD